MTSRRSPAATSLKAALTAGAAVLALILAIAVYVRPVGILGPGLPGVLALLLAVRWGVLRQRQKRQQILDAVPRRPLGLFDDAEEEADSLDHPPPAA